MDTTGAPCDNFIDKGHKNGIGNNGDNNTKDRLGVMALISVMEPATENQAFKPYKQPLKGHPSNKIKVLLDSGDNGDLFFLP